MKRLAAIFALLALSAQAADIDLGALALESGGSAPTGFVCYTNVVARPRNGSAALVAVTSGATLAADSANWPDGSSVLAVVKPSGVYAPTAALELVGYGAWPTNAFQAVCWRLGGKVKVNVISEFASAPSVTTGDDGEPSGVSPVGWTYLDNTVVYQPNGNSVDITLAVGETLAASASDWPDGQSVLAAIHPAGAYSVLSSISLVGYGAWPTEDFYAVFWRVGSTFYASIVNS